MKDKNQNTMNSMLHNLSRNDWDEYITVGLKTGIVTDSDLCEISDYLTSHAVLCAELSSYLDTRGGIGCGDSGHEKAMKKAQVTRKKIRKAFGYTYP